MQDSMMMAEVGCMVKVSGNRMATPLGPPRPGSTPMMIPSTMPIAIMPMLYQVSAIANPWNREPRSSTCHPPSATSSVAEQGFERSFGQRHHELHFKHPEQRKRAAVLDV